MEKRDLKLMWGHIQKSVQNAPPELVNIEKIRKMKHGELISKVITGLKLKISVYLFSLVILIGILLYAYVYLKLGFSIPVIIPFAVAGLFLFYKVTSEFFRLSLITKDSVNLTLKDSAIFFMKNLKRIKSSDFAMYFLLCWGIAIGFAIGYLINVDFRLLFQSNDMGFLLIVFDSILLIIPWVIKRSFEVKYKNLFSHLDETIDYFND